MHDAQAESKIVGVKTVPKTTATVKKEVAMLVELVARQVASHAMTMIQSFALSVRSSSLARRQCSDVSIRVPTELTKYYRARSVTQHIIMSFCFLSFQFMNYHCITAEECRNLNVYRNSENLYIPFQGVCREGCPPDFQLKFAVDGNKMSASCTPCMGKECWKTCKSQLIDSVSSAQALKGCQVIDGALDIQINPGKSADIKTIVKELENSLSGIVEIDGYMKIARSSPIISLGFLRNLKVIRGKQLESNKYSLVIWDNKNLEQLFGQQKIVIENGKVLLNYNPRLCSNEIDGFSSSIENFENAKMSNGYEKLCNASQIDVNVVDIQSDEAKLKWSPLKLQQNQALSYVAFYSVANDDRSNDDE